MILQQQGLVVDLFFRSTLKAPRVACQECCAQWDCCSPGSVLQLQMAMMQAAQPHAACRRPFNPTHSVPAAIHCLSRLLRERSVRVLFQRVSGSVQLLAPLLRSNASSAAPNQQLLYEAGMCVWQLTFYEPAAEAMGSSGVVQGLVDMARSATKEKVTYLFWYTP